MDSSGHNRPSVKGDDKTDPAYLARQSINMIYTPSKPVQIKSPDHLPKLEEKKEPLTPRMPTAARKVPSPTPPPTATKPGSPRLPTVNVPGGPYHALLKARPPTVGGPSEFDPLMKCPRCKRRILEPKIMCCERVCQECLQLDIEHKSRDGVMWCEVCGKTVLIPNTKVPKRDWAKNFETDTFLAHLREAVVQLEGKRLCYVCHSRRATQDAVNYCFDCDTYFCFACTEAHRHMPNQKKHRVKPADQVRATDLMKLKKRFCLTHEGEPLNLYCPDHKTVMCPECAGTVHRNCAGIGTVANMANEKKEKLKTAEKVLKVGLTKCEHNTQRLQSETTEIENLKAQTVDEIDSSFDEVIAAIQARREKLKKDIQEHFNSDMPVHKETTKSYETLMLSMQLKTNFVKQLMDHASDFDILTNADNVFDSAENMVSQNKDYSGTPRPKVMIKIDDSSVKNFLELTSLLGAEVGSVQVKGIMLKKITTKMKGDQHTPDIRDILVADEGNIIAVDNRNACVKSIKADGERFLTKRLELKTEPWGGTKLQSNMIAVTGLKVIYIITVTDDLCLQSTIKTRKDYWGVCAISPINMACSCKYPPSVDIVDITGRRLRSIEVDVVGANLFEMPGYVAMNGDTILVTDRARKSLTCVDQEGNVIFVYKGTGEEELKFPRGMCVDKQRRIFVCDHDRGCVHLLSPRGEYLCQVMACGRPRTLCLDTHGKMLYLSTEGKGLTFYNLLEVQS